MFYRIWCVILLLSQLLLWRHWDWKRSNDRPLVEARFQNMEGPSLHFPSSPWSMGLCYLTSEGCNNYIFSFLILNSVCSQLTFTFIFLLFANLYLTPPKVFQLIIKVHRFSTCSLQKSWKPHTKIKPCCIKSQTIQPGSWSGSHPSHSPHPISQQ